MEEKSSSGRFLGIANLILTAVIGIGIALFLNYRDEQLKLTLSEREEKLQKELLTQKSEIERKSSFAHIEVGCSSNTTCSGPVAIKNTGPQIAKNFRTVMRIDYFSGAWEDKFNDINDFSFYTFSTAMKFNTKPENVHQYFSPRPVKGFKALEVSAETLPVGTFYLGMLLGSAFPTTSYTLTKPITVYFQPRLTDAEKENLWIRLDQYIPVNFNLARFSVSTTCDNCEDIGKSDSTFTITSGHIGASTWTITRKTIIPKTANLDVTLDFPREEEIEIREGAPYLEFRLPRGIPQNIDDSPIFLILGKSQSGDPRAIILGQPIPNK